MKKLMIVGLCLISIKGIAQIGYTHSIKAGNPVKVQQFINNKEWNFVENKGQLSSSDIQYYGHQGGVYLYCKSGKVSFVFTKTESKGNDQISEATSLPSGFPLPKGAGGIGRESIQPTKISTSCTDLVLLNSNPNSQIIATDKQEYYENYYNTDDADHGITNVHTFKTITYKSIYPNIDMVLNCKEQGMEYSFIVHPGGKVSEIQLQWNGTEDVKSLAYGGFKFSNSLGTLEESAPKSFVEGKMVESSFIKNGFKVGRYDEGKDLVIDPTLSWATYYGGGGVGANSVSTDANGNIYITGTGGIATAGAYQTSGGGGFLAKFSSTGSLSWSTYYGGSKNSTVPYGVTTATSGNVYITGTGGISTAGAYQTVGGQIFLAKFSSSGSLSWSTFYGGNKSEFAFGISTDAFENVYISGMIYNTGAFLAKFSSSGNLSWDTYFGGSGAQAFGVCTDSQNNVLITGETQNGGYATSGAYQTSYAGGVDAFIAKFGSSGSLTWATYYGGSGGDQGEGVSTDASGNVYVTGYTLSSKGIATSGAYQTSLGGSNGNSNAFLAKFSSTGSLSWATYYGGSGGDQANCVSADTSGNIYIAGQTASKSGIATPGAYQTSYAGGIGNDAFLAKFSSTGNLSWATYYGGKSNDIANGIRTDTYGNVYLTGETQSSNGIATSGAYQTYYSVDNAFLSKFRFKPFPDDAGIDSIKNPFGIVCGGKQLVKINLHNYGSLTLTSVKIGWSINGKLQTNYNWTGTLSPTSATTVMLGLSNFILGGDTIKAWTSEPNGQTDSVPENDTSKQGFTINPLPDTSWSVSNVSENYYFKVQDSSLAKSSYSWNFGDGTPTATGYSITHVFPKNKVYLVKLIVTNTNGCTGVHDSTINVTVSGIKPMINTVSYGISIYPNPFTDKTLINFTLPETSHVKVSVMDMKGNVLFVPADKTISPGPNEIEINTSEAGLSSGTYFVNITINDQFINRKIIEIR